MASHSNPTLGFSLVQELGSNEIIKRNRVSLVNPGGRRQEIIIPENSFNLKIEHLEPWKPFCSLRNSNHFVEFDSTMMNPRLLDVHETGQEEVIDFLLSRAEELKERGFDMSLLSDLDQEPVKPLLDLMMHNPVSSINPYAQILFSSSRAEASIASELHMSKKSARWRKLSRLVPQFQRRLFYLALPSSVYPPVCKMIKAYMQEKCPKELEAIRKQYPFKPSKLHKIGETSIKEMGQNQSSDEDEILDEEMPRCIVSDPAQPHNFSQRARQKVKHDCTECGQNKVPWEIRECDDFHYYCTICDLEFHQQCLEKPSKIIHPYHPHHPLVLTVLNYETGMISDTSFGEYYRFQYRHYIENSEYPETIQTKPNIMFDICTWCGNDLINGWFYRCKICNFSLDFHCALNFPPLTIQNPKSHHHSLSLFPRPLSFPCNACGLINVLEPSYACYQCNYVVHQSCIDLPRVIKITRHPHRLSHTPYLPAKVLPCRICYKNVDIKYGQYSCNHEDCSYVAHAKCATHYKIWDGEELEWDIEDPDEAEDVAPYKKKGGGLIEHCWHQNHYLKLENYNNTKESKKQCQACMRSITSHDFYSCIECNFFLHEVCANLPRKMDHPLHNHPLFMDPYPIYDTMFLMLDCSACYRKSSGLKYRCKKEGCVDKGKHFQVDVNCILVPECYTHESHAEHSLFISTIYKDNLSIRCLGCMRNVYGYHLQCCLCEYVICYTCATIPQEIYHKYDVDPLSLCYGESGVDDTYWCEVCEETLDPREWFYTNTKSCTTIHKKCVFGDNIYMKYGHTFDHYSDKVEVVGNGSSSRPICHTCHKYCRHHEYFKVYMPGGTEVNICSIDCHQI